jgi:hypothetical protein
MRGAALVVLGLALLSAMVAYPERLRVPALIGYSVAATFAIAGLLALANEFCSDRIRSWLAVALLALMAVPSIWISVGPGKRSCTFQARSLGETAGDGVCRTAFGIGSVLVLLMLLMALRQALARK